MMTETRDSMNKAFDTFGEGFRAAVDSAQRTQETWFNFMRDSWRQPADFNRVFQSGERIMREWMPFVGGTMNTVAKAADANWRAGMDVFRTYCDGLSRGETGDVGKTTRQVWDATFDAMRTNFDVMNRVTARTMENCASFCEAAFTGDNNGTTGSARANPNRPAPKGEKVAANN